MYGAFFAPPLAATHVRMLIAIKWLIVITVY